jgi:hypothetical protein
MLAPGIVDADTAASVHYNYFDGTFAEVNCGKENAEFSPDVECTLSVGKGDDVKKFAFDLYEYGYEFEFVQREFEYYSSSGALSIPVTCIDKDISALREQNKLPLPHAVPGQVDCRITLFPKQDKLRADRVDIIFCDGGVYYVGALFFGHDPDKDPG